MWSLCQISTYLLPLISFCTVGVCVVGGGCGGWGAAALVTSFVMFFHLFSLERIENMLRILSFASFSFCSKVMELLRSSFWLLLNSQICTYKRKYLLIISVLFRYLNEAAVSSMSVLSPSSSKSEFELTELLLSSGLSMFQFSSEWKKIILLKCVDICWTLYLKVRNLET